MQFGGSVIIWFGLNRSLELYQQLNKRLDRPGQTKPVRIIHILTQGTIDMVAMAGLESNARNQKEFMNFIKCKLI
jgi:SNF2 family DNA or RNA helicase